MRDLATPLRVTWDLPPDPALAERLAVRLAEGRVLFVEVQVDAGAVGSVSALGALRDRARLTLAGDAETLELALGRLGPGSLPAPELQVLPPFGAAAARLAASGRRVVPALWSTPGGVTAFGAALALAAEHRLGTVAVLNPRSPADPLDAGDRARAAAVWAASPDPRPALRVHDLFLAEAMGLDPWREYRGCQAGQGFAHVTAAGEVLACRTLPVLLGRLDRDPLEAAWAGPARRALRAALAEAPTACGPCALAATCAGGCRGLATHLGIDPSCPGPKP